MHQPHTEHKLISQPIDPSHIKPEDVGDTLQKTFGLTLTKSGALITFKSDGVIEAGAYKMPAVKKGVVLRRLHVVGGNVIAVVRRKDINEAYATRALATFMQKAQAFANQNPGKTFDFKFHDHETVKNPGDIQQIGLYTLVTSDGATEVKPLETVLEREATEKISALDITNGTISLATHDAQRNKSTISKFDENFNPIGDQVEIDGFTYRVANDGGTLILGTLNPDISVTRIQVLGPTYTTPSTLRNFEEKGTIKRLTGLESTSHGILGTFDNGETFLCTKKGIAMTGAVEDLTSTQRFLGTVGSGETIAFSDESGVNIQQFGQASSASASA